MARVGGTRIGGGLGRNPMGFQMDPGWEKYNNATDVKRFKRKFARHRKRALDEVARVIIAEALKAGSFERNASLTEAIKQGNKPLHDTGKELVGAFRTRLIRKDALFVGIPQNHKFYFKARTIHEGAILKVTGKMRAMFVMLWLASKGDIPESQLTGRAAELFARKSTGWLPLRQSTTVIRIPARAFMDDAFSSEKTKREMLRRFTRAVDQTLAELARGK